MIRLCKKLKKEVKFMTEQMNIKLTDDPLTNIGIMVTLLNDNAREAISYLMYGCYLGEVLADRKKEK
jgi:hypothetical protein